MNFARKNGANCFISFAFTIIIKNKMEEPNDGQSHQRRHENDLFLHCPEKFYLCSAFSDHPPPKAKGITEDSRLLLYALHEQATRSGGLREKEALLKPTFWQRLVDPESVLRYEAWKMVSNMPAIVAMEKYCEEVENFNQNWWQLMTENASYEEKAKMLSMADESSEEYYLQVGMRLLVPPTETETMTSSSPSEREGIRTFGSVIFSGGERSVGSPRKGRGDRGKSRFALESKMPEKNEWRTIVAQPMKKTTVAANDNDRSNNINNNNSREKKLETTTRQRFPQKRFGHIAHKVGEELIISHGNKDGRLLSDCWALDLMELRWKRKELKWPGSPCADAASIATADGEIYLFRGIGTKSDEDALLVTTNTTNSDSNNSKSTNMVEKKMMMTVSKLDLSDIGGKLNELKWQHVAAVGSSGSSDLPCARTGHTATLFETDDVVYVFGGMSVGDAKKNVKSVPLNDLWEFSLITKTWRQILTTTTTTKTEGEESEKSSCSKSYVPCASPTARGSHVAGRCGRFLLVFGGAAGNVLSDTDVHCFDTRAYQWIKVASEIPDDDDKKLIKIAPRAGHCATMSEDGTKMFICGGGDNQSALLETLSLDCSELLSEFSEKVKKTKKNDDDHDDNNDNRNNNSSSSPPKLSWSLLVESSSLTGKEGMTLTTIPCQSGEYLLAFGGLTGTSDCEVSCLRTA